MANNGRTYSYGRSYGYRRRAWNKTYTKTPSSRQRYRSQYVTSAVYARSIPVHRDRSAYYSTVISSTADQALQSNGNTPSNATLQLTLQNIEPTQLAAWQATFKSYRLRKIVIRISPPSNQINVLQAAEPVFGTNTTAFNWKYYTAIDYNQAVTPATASQIQMYDTCKSTSVLQPQTRIIYPMMNVPVTTIGGTGISGRAIMKASDKWFDLASPNVSFGCLHWFCDVLTDGAQTTQPFTFQVQTEFHLDLRSTF